MFVKNNKVWTFNHKWMRSPLPLRNVILHQTTGGTISAQPMSGHDGDEVTLSNSPATNYTFNSYSVTGAVLEGNKFSFAGSDVDVQGSWTYHDPYNPLNLPSHTIRVRFQDGYTPESWLTSRWDSYHQVSSSPNVWDITKNGTSWDKLLMMRKDISSSTSYPYLKEVLGANSSGVTNMHLAFEHGDMTSMPLFDTSSVTNMNTMFRNCVYLTQVPLYDTHNVTTCADMFYNCIALTTVPLFNLSNVTDVYDMFRQCTALTALPAFNLNKVTDMEYFCQKCSSLTAIPNFSVSRVTDCSYAFEDCPNVQSGAYNMYQKLNNLGTVQYHIETFRNCGNNDNIPNSWKVYE